MNKRKKIVIGISDLCIGGAQQQLIRLLHEVDHVQFEVHVVTVFSCGERTDIQMTLSKKVTLHHVPFKSFKDIRGWKKLYSLLKQLSPDVVMTSLFFCNTVFRLLQIFLRYPIITREHNTYINKSKSEILTDRLLSSRNYKIVAVSDEVASFTVTQQHVSDSLVEVIYNGIDFDQIDSMHKTHNRDSVRKEYGIPSESTVAVCVGRLASQKNVEALIRAFVPLHNEFPSYVLLIVGGGSLFQELEIVIAELHAHNFIKLLGVMKDPHPIYVAADLFVSMSDIEGMSNTHLEALAHSIPIITTKTGGTSAIITHEKNGYILSDTTAPVFRQACLWYEHVPREVVLKEIALKKKYFSISHIKDLYENLWNRAL